MSILLLKLGYVVKLSLSPQDFPWALPLGSPLELSYILLYIPPLLQARLDKPDIRAGDPDLGGVGGVPPPAEDIFSGLQVLRNCHVVLEDPNLLGLLGSWVQKPPGTSFRVGANAQISLLCHAPLFSKILLTSISVEGLIISKFEDILSKAFLCESSFALSWQLAQPVGVTASMAPTRDEGHWLHAASNPLGSLDAGECNVKCA